MAKKILLAWLIGLLIIFNISAILTYEELSGDYQVSNSIMAAVSSISEPLTDSVKAPTDVSAKKPTTNVSIRTTKTVKENKKSSGNTAQAPPQSSSPAPSPISSPVTPSPISKEDNTKGFPPVPPSSPPNSTEFLLELAKDTYNFLNLMESSSGKGLPDNWYKYPSTGAYTSPEETGFYMLSHVGANEMGLIDANTAKARVEKTLGVLKNLTTYSQNLGFDWQIGTNDAPPDYTGGAFDEFDNVAPYDFWFNVGLESVNTFPKEMNAYGNSPMYINYTLSGNETEDRYLLLDTLYATHYSPDQAYFEIKVETKKSSEASYTTIGTYRLGSDTGNYPEEVLVRIPKERLSFNSGSNVIRISRFAGDWVIFDSLSLSRSMNTGLYYRYYNTNSTKVTVTAVPSIGNAMLAASLITTKGWANENGFSQIASDCDSIVNKMNLSMFYNSSSKRFFHDSSKTYEWDYYSDEGRLLSLVANALGAINDSQFSANLNALTKRNLYYDVSTGNTVASATAPEDILVNKTSWDGSMFTYLVPTLFIREKDTSYQTSTINPVVLAQMAYANNSNYKLNGKVAWGISDAYNIDGNYCWDFVGSAPTDARYLNGKQYETCPGLITPHASALALLSNSSDSAIENLQNLANYSTLYDSNYGFKDSVNVLNGQIFNGIVTLDQEWLFLSLMNYMNQTIWDNFYKDSRIVNAHLAMYPDSAKPQSAGSVRIIGGDMFVNGTEFQIRGVNYHPVPIGQNPPNWPDTAAFYDRDFALIKKMNATAIRIIGVASPTLLDRANVAGLKVIAGYWIDPTSNYADATFRNNTINAYRTYVASLKNKPALLMWGIGNENNYGGGDIAAYHSLVNQMAQTAYVEEGANYHPVAVINGDVMDIGNSGRGTTDAQMGYVDVWGANVYRGATFTTLWNDFTSRSSKPLWIAEFGTDSYNNTAGAEYREVQAQYDAGLWNEIKSGNYLGGTVFEWVDEYWKGSGGSNSVQESLGLVLSSLPDGYANEEYWGMVAVAKNGTGYDYRYPKSAYYAMRDAFRGYNNAPVLNTINNITVNEGSLISITPVAVDADGDDLTYAFTTPLNSSGKWQTNLSSSGVYTITVAVTDGKLSDSQEVQIIVNDVDFTIPGSITGLSYSSKSSNWIYWTWTNPADADFAAAIVYLNGVNVANTSNNYYNATGLNPSTSYTIRINTKDLSNNINTTNVSNTQVTNQCSANPDCDDGLYCNGAETCNAGACQSGSSVDCSANNLLSILTCAYSPDDNPFTWDSFAGFTSSCNEASDSCTTGTISLTHTCNMTCDAECITNANCADTDCDILDACVGNDYYDYSDVPNTCDSGSCSCSDNACGAPAISTNDARCISIVDNDADGFNSTIDCNDNNASIHPEATEVCNRVDDNCNGQIDEGVCADLRIKSYSLYWPASPLANSWIMFKVILENAGYEPATNISWKMDSDSADSGTSSSGINLGVGKYITIYPQYKYASAGSYNPKFIADYPDTIIESNESNNEVVIPVVVA